MVCGNCSREEYIHKVSKRYPLSVMHDEEGKVVAFSGFHNDGQIGLVHVVSSNRNQKLAPKILARIL